MQTATMSGTVTTLERPVYSMGQAARLLRLPTDTVRRWIDGYTRVGVRYAPVIREEPTGADLVTWGEFVEAGYLREYRRRRVSLQYLRPVISILRARLGVRYPLAHARPFVADRRLVLDVQEELGLNPQLRMVTVSGDEQLVLAPPAEAFFEKVEFDQGSGGVAERLFPFGRDARVALDPERSFGEPTVAGGIRTDVLAELVAAGESLMSIAAGYDLLVEDVQAAVSYERASVA
jgi:uncharacterized protein (DUF433 family)